MNDRVDKIIAFEQGDLPEDEIIALFQDMVNDGTVWKLQGSYIRMARSLIYSGYVTEPGAQGTYCPNCKGHYPEGESASHCAPCDLCESEGHAACQCGLR